MRPRSIKRDGLTGLEISWDDGHISRHTLQSLRKNCPCAGCRNQTEQHEGTFLLPVLTPGENELAAIEPVGNYALQFKWIDGHITGIYSYDYLRSLCECTTCAS